MNERASRMLTSRTTIATTPPRPASNSQCARVRSATTESEAETRTAPTALLLETTGTVVLRTSSESSTRSAVVWRPRDAATISTEVLRSVPTVGSCGPDGRDRTPCGVDDDGAEARLAVERVGEVLQRVGRGRRGHGLADTERERVRVGLHLTREATVLGVREREAERELEREQHEHRQGEVRDEEAPPHTRAPSSRNR